MASERKKRQPSSVELLPAPVRRLLQELLDNPRITQLQAVEKINAALAELRAAGDPDALDPACPEAVSKSALNRYALRMEEVGAKIRQSREIADMYISKVGAAPQGQTGLLINEMLRTMAFDLTLKIQDAALDDPETLAATIDQVKALSLAVQRLEQSATINVKREAEIRQQVAAKAADTAEKIAKKGGLSAETIQHIRKEILGIAT